MHLHLGPGFGDVRHARPRPTQPDFAIPIQKWLCLAVTIDVDNSAGTTTLKYYLNGELWGPPSVYNKVYNMNGTADLYINNNGNPNYSWKGKLDQFSMWKSVISAEEVNEYCNCEVGSS